MGTRTGQRAVFSVNDMTNRELKETLLSEEQTVTAVLLDGTEIHGILDAIIYGKSGNDIRVTAQVRDKNERTAYIVTPDRIRKEKENGKHSERLQSI